MEFKDLSDQQLEDILREAADADKQDSRFGRASVELDLRRKNRLFSHQEKLYKTVETSAEKIVDLLAYISRKPVMSVLLATILTITIGVTINIVSAWLEHQLNLR